MDLAELVGGALYDARDVEGVGSALERLLLDRSARPSEALSLGLEPTLVEALRKTLPHEASSIRLACQLGVAWVKGRRSVRPDQPWELVLTGPPAIAAAVEIRRSTAETLLGLIARAEKRIRLMTPFVDAGALTWLVDALSAACGRGVRIEVITTSASIDAEAVLETLRQRVGHGLLGTQVIREPAFWPHLKVVTVDGRWAYVGSANLTGPGLGGRNVELGVLLSGDRTSVIDDVIDRVRAGSGED